MMTLTTLTALSDGMYYAKWCDSTDGIAVTIGALHDQDGRLLSANLGAQPPRLTGSQIAAAVPDQHPTTGLLAKLIKARPDLAAVGEKAVRLVKDKQVRLTGPDTAVVTGDTNQYDVRGQRCDCKYGRVKGGWCSHRVAVRMARALDQAVQPLTDAEKEARCEARAQANRDRQKAQRPVNTFEQHRRQARRDGDGARQYLRMQYANGGGAAVTLELHRRIKNGG